MLFDAKRCSRECVEISADSDIADTIEMPAVEGHAVRVARQDAERNDATSQAMSRALHEMPSDIQVLIFSALPFHTFVRVLRICKVWNGSGLLDRLGSGKIREMGRATNGRDIMAALQRSKDEATMSPDWEAALLLSFASRVEHIELHDHARLTDAWMARLQTLKDIALERYTSSVVGEIDTLYWFAQRPCLRYALCDQPMPALFCASDPRSICLLPSTGMPRILASIAPYHVHPLRSRCALYPLMETAANVLWLAACGTPMPVPFSLLRDYAWEWLMKGDLTLSVSDVLRDKFNISITCQRRELDPFIVEKLLRFAINAHLSLRDACDRWRVADAGFLSLLEQHAARCMIRKAYRERKFEEHCCTLPEDVDVGRRVRETVWYFETYNGALFAGDARLEADFANYCHAIAHAGDMGAWQRLWDQCTQMPWRVVPALMQRLAGRRIVIATNWTDENVGDEATFVKFIAWRDRVVPLCLAEGEFDLAARACAAPIAASCQPRRIFRALRERIQWNIHPEALVNEAGAGLAYLTPKYWQEILESIACLPLTLACRDLQREWIDQFLLSSEARARYPSSAFGYSLVVRASQIWATLPDQAQGEKTRLDVFCERFDLVAATREQLRAAIIDDISKRVAESACTLDDALRDAGFENDIDARRLVEHKVWYLGLCGTTMGSGSMPTAFLSPANGSAFLRNQAAIYLAGTEGEVTLEPL